MGWNKQYDHKKPYKHVRCVFDSVLLNNGFIYGVIDEEETKYLIQFRSGGAKWYDKTRFIDADGPYTNVFYKKSSKQTPKPVPVKKPEPVKKEEENTIKTHKLF